jgi:hypothetical protein
MTYTRAFVVHQDSRLRKRAEIRLLLVQLTSIDPITGQRVAKFSSSQTIKNNYLLKLKGVYGTNTLTMSSYTCLRSQQQQHNNSGETPRAAVAKYNMYTQQLLYSLAYIHYNLRYTCPGEEETN